MFLTLFLVFAPILGSFLLGGLAESLRPWREAGSRELQWIQSFVLACLSVIVISIAVPLGHVGISRAVTQTGIGLFAWIPLPAVVAIGLGILMLDAAEWFGHWSTHRVPALWRLHAVHHSDEFLDTSTAFRFHPVEVLYRYAVVGLAVAIFAIPAQAIVIYAVLAIGFNLWEHANVRTPAWTRRLASVFITPELHRLHHSDERQHHDSNYGIILSLWDRAFGTLVPPHELTERTRFGLGPKARSKYERLGQLLLAPLRKL